MTGALPMQGLRGAFARLVIILAVIAGALALSGCGGPNYSRVSIADANRMVADGYRLGAGDKLRVTVFDEPTLTGEYDVGATGVLAMPLIAEVKAAGQTPQQVAGEITKRLADGGYVLSPRVAVEVTKYRPFYILGEVNKPGEYAYTGQLSLLQAIALAGGFTARADKDNVVVRRSGWPTPHKVSAEDIPLLIAPGDTVTVPEAFF